MLRKENGMTALLFSGISLSFAATQKSINVSGNGVN
jgi:hypothetical protein